MSATLSRVNLYEALTNAARVADKSGKLAFAKFARIEAKAADRNVMITTFNGQTAIESVLAGDVADEIAEAIANPGDKPELFQLMPI